MYTGHRRTLNSKSVKSHSDRFGRQRQDYKLIVVLKKIVYMKNVSEIMFGWRLTFDAVYAFTEKARFY